MNNIRSFGHLIHSSQENYFLHANLDDIKSFMRTFEFYIQNAKNPQEIEILKKQIENVEKSILEKDSSCWRKTLLCRIIRKSPEFALKYISFFKFSINLKEADGNCPLLEACQLRHADLVQVLIENGADVQQLDRFNMTALGVCIHAAKFFPDERDEKIFNALLESKCNVKGKADLVNSSALVACLSKGYVDWAWRLLPNSDVNQANNLKLQAIHLATRLGAKDLVAELIKRGAEVNNLALPSLTATRRVTPCHISVINGQSEILEQLLTNGVSAHLPAENPYYGRGDNKEPLTAFQMAEKYKRTECKDLIEKYSFPQKREGFQGNSLNASETFKSATPCQPRTRANANQLPVILNLDQNSLIKQADVLKSTNSLNTKSYSELAQAIKMICEKIPEIRAFLAQTLLLGRLSKNMPENKTGFTFLQTETSILIHIPKIVFKQGAERKIKFAINLSTGDLIGLMKNLNTFHDGLAGDRLVHERCPNNEHLLTHYHFETDIKQNGHEGKWVYVKLYSLGDASSLMNHSQNLSKGMVIHYAYSIAKGIQALHHAKITHNDIKLENLFLTDNPKIPVILGDFGIVVDWKNGQNQPVEIGSLSSIAPERIRESDQTFDFEKHSQGDMYSLGTVLYRLLAKQPLYFQNPTKDGPDQVKFILRDESMTLESLKISFKQLDDDNGIHSFCKSLLAFHPSDRPSIDEAIKQLESMISDKD